VRVAAVRGPNLNPWELQNLPVGEADVVAFASHRGQFAMHDADVDVPVRRLFCPQDAVARLPGLLAGLTRRLTGSLDHLAGLEKALRGFDVAHVAELVTPYSLQAIRAREQGAVRAVVATVWENIALPAPENALVARRARQVAEGADHFIAITDRARLHLEVAGVPPERITVQPMGIDLDRFRPAGAPRGDGPLEILCVARLVPEKGVEDVVVALGLLRERGVRARATFVGSGPQAARLSAIASRLGVGDDVVLTGPKPYAELPDAYRAADVFVLASGPRTTWREQFGFAVVEAMASGLPVVAGHSGSLAEVVVEPGSLVTPHDPQLLADHLEALAADPALRRSQGDRNRAIAEERYDRRQIRERLLEIYAAATER
jgi:glycosyltransferase involved in cell wall biosynthesis